MGANNEWTNLVSEMCEGNHLLEKVAIKQRSKDKKEKARKSGCGEESRRACRKTPRSENAWPLWDLRQVLREGAWQVQPGPDPEKKADPGRSLGHTGHSFSSSLDLAHLFANLDCTFSDS